MSTYWPWPHNPHQSSYFPALLLAGRPVNSFSSAVERLVWRRRVTDVWRRARLKWHASHKVNQFRTWCYKTLRPCDSPCFVFIVGCQRSGTTVFADAISLSPKVTRYGEGDQPYFYPEDSPKKLRLRENEVLRELLRREKSSHIVLKPLYESQFAPSYLSAFQGSKALWIYRGYEHVAHSHIHKYTDTNGVAYVEDMLERRKRSWKNEYITDDAVALLDAWRGRDPNSATGYAIVWYVRTSMYFAFADTPNLKLVSYEKLVRDPVESLASVYRFLDLPFDPDYAYIVNSHGVSRRVTLDIAPDVRERCEELMRRLDSTPQI